MYRAGEIDRSAIEEVNSRLAPTTGTCMVMGTASTMACMAEALGMMLPGGATIPAVHAERLRHAENAGRRAVKIAAQGIKPSTIMTADAFHNALVTLQAIGGSTNGLIHITAVAKRLGIHVDLEYFDRLGHTVPVVVDLKPSGDHYMEHLHEAGGLNAVLRAIRPHLKLDILTISGTTLEDHLCQGEQVPGQRVIRPGSDPIYANGGLVILHGNLAPRGGVLKVSAATPSLLQAEGRAVVFDSLEDLAKRIDSPDLEVCPDDVLVLRNAGPQGPPECLKRDISPFRKNSHNKGPKT